MGKYLSIGIAASLLFAHAAMAQTQPFEKGWNKVVATNCLFVPGNPGNPTAVPPVPPVLDMVDVFVEIDQGLPPTLPPPVPVTGEFTTTDQIAIGLVAPFCKDGSAFYFYWDGTKAVYFSIYPNLT